MVQLAEQPERERMFHENYAFFSTTSARMAMHFKELADLVIEDHLKAADPFVVEIGSNDGITLRHFAKAGIRHLGIEPEKGTQLFFFHRSSKFLNDLAWLQHTL